MNKLRVKEARAGYLFIMPWLIGFFVFVLGPIIAAFIISMMEWDLLSSPKWVGFGNYSTLVKDPLFWQSLKVTTIYTAVSVPLGIIIGFSIALLMNNNIKGLSFWRTIYYLPAVISGVAVSMLWMWVFNPDFGILNLVLSFFGIQGPGWLADPRWSLPALIIMSLWGAGGGMIIYLAGLQSIPTELYEAASIDGATAWKKFWNITVPMMTPVLFFQLIMGMIGAFQTFTQAYVMTNGGPEYSTLFYALYLYDNAFRYYKMGYASSLAVVLFVIIISLTIILFITSNKWVYYASGEEGR